jgi:hypothetical protein
LRHPLLGPLGLRAAGMKPAVGQAMTVRTYFFGCVSFLTLVLGSSAALAEKREGHASAALLAGYGTTNDENVLGLGAGVRLGYSFGFGLYTGVVGLAHLGTHDGDSPRNHSQSVRAELGYELHLQPIVLRPSLRAGVAYVTTSFDENGSFVSPDVGLGISLLYPIGRCFVGADFDARTLTRPVHNGDNYYSHLSAAGYATLGYNF